MHKKPIIGLTGTFASGKDSLANFLDREYRYMHLSTSDILRQEALRLRGSVERPVLAEVANQLRKTEGPDVLVQIALKMFAAHADKYDGAVISGVRSIGEAETIKEMGGKIVFTDAPVELRYQRMAGRQRDAETKLTFDEFKAGEDKEMQTDFSDKSVQNLGAMREMADIRLTNGASLDEFLANAKKELQL